MTCPLTDIIVGEFVTLHIPHWGTEVHAMVTSDLW